MALVLKLRDAVDSVTAPLYSRLILDLSEKSIYYTLKIREFIITI
jgi:hypothetical protein